MSFDLSKNEGMQPALTACQAVADGTRWSAVLAGPPGNGKTHLAIAAMNAYGLQRSFFWKVPDFLDWLRNMAYGDGARVSIDELTRGYRTGEALIVFDDLGAENGTDWAHEQLYRVLDARCDAKIPTVITTNRDQTRLDARIVDRYWSGLVVCKGRSMRRG